MLTEKLQPAKRPLRAPAHNVRRCPFCQPSELGAKRQAG